MPRGRVALGTPPSRGRGRARGEEAGEAAHPCGGPARAAWTPWTRGGRPWTRLSCTGTSLPRTKRDALSRGAFQPPSPGALPAPARGARGREATPPRSLGPGAGARPLFPPPHPPLRRPSPASQRGGPSPSRPWRFLSWAAVWGQKAGRQKQKPARQQPASPTTPRGGATAAPARAALVRRADGLRHQARTLRPARRGTRWLRPPSSPRPPPPTSTWRWRWWR